MPKLHDLVTDNIRVDLGDDQELRESLKSFGWMKEFPALVDEHGVVLVGHRRLEVAKALNIEPVIKTLRLGDGDEADGERLKLALASNIGFKAMTPKDRRRIAEHLYGAREWTMQRIAEALGTSTATIGRDLDRFSHHEKTPSRPKGGRPKGSRPKKPSYEKVVALHDDGVSTAEISKEIGIGARRVGLIIQQENAYRAGQADPIIDPTTLSATAQAKLASALKQQKHQHEMEFKEAVRQETLRRLNEVSLPFYAEQWKETRELLDRRKGHIPRAMFKKILACLHPDSRRNVSDERLTEVFREFEKLELVMVDNRELPTHPAGWPNAPTYQEMMRRKAEVSAARKAKRNARAMARA